MSVWLAFVWRLTRRYRGIDRLRPLQHVGHVGHVGSRGLFDHFNRDCNRDTLADRAFGGEQTC